LPTLAFASRCVGFPPNRNWLMPGGSVLVQLYPGRLHNLSPLFGFGSNKVSEFAGRLRYWFAAKGLIRD